MEIEERSRLMMTKVLLILNTVLLCLGSTGSPLLLRLYFIHVCKRMWLSSRLLTAGFPIILIPLTIAYLQRRHGSQQSSLATENHNAKIVLMVPPLFLAAAFIGTLTGFDNYLYAYGVAKLPVSTSALVIATQLGLTAGFAFVLVKQKCTFYSINSVALLTVGAAVLALHASGDRPAGESTKQYVTGLLLTLASPALYGFVLPSIELTYRKARQAMTYALVMEIQFVISLFATLLCTIGMIINNDFKGDAKRSKGLWARCNEVLFCVGVERNPRAELSLGAVGVIFCASSLVSGIIIAVLLPVTEVIAVLFYKEKFHKRRKELLWCCRCGASSLTSMGRLKKATRKLPRITTQKQKRKQGCLKQSTLERVCSFQFPS